MSRLYFTLGIWLLMVSAAAAQFFNPAMFMPTSAGTWSALIPGQAPTSAGAGFSGYELRSRFNAALYLGPAPATGTKIRVTVGGGGGAANVITAMFCGHTVTASPSLNYDGTQVQMKFSGANNISLPTGTVVSDAINYSFDKTKDFVCSFNWGSSSAVFNFAVSANILSGNVAAGGGNAGNNTTTATGTASQIYGIFLIEVFH